MNSQPWLSPDLWEVGAEMSVTTHEDGVTIRGTRAGLRVLARIVEAIADGGAEGDHCHLEPGMELEEGKSLVLDLVASISGGSGVHPQAPASARMIRFDPAADAAYIQIAPEIGAGGVAKTYMCDPLEVGGMINLDFDDMGRLIGLEVLDASKRLPPGLLPR